MPGSCTPDIPLKSMKLDKPMDKMHMHDSRGIDRPISPWLRPGSTLSSARGRTCSIPPMTFRRHQNRLSSRLPRGSSNSPRHRLRHLRRNRDRQATSISPFSFTHPHHGYPTVWRTDRRGEGLCQALPRVAGLAQGRIPARLLVALGQAAAPGACDQCARCRAARLCRGGGCCAG